MTVGRTYCYFAKYRARAVAHRLFAEIEATKMRVIQEYFSDIYFKKYEAQSHTGNFELLLEKRKGLQTKVTVCGSLDDRILKILLAQGFKSLSSDNKR